MGDPKTKDRRTLARSEAAAELHRMASQLESGELSYGPGEPIAVPEEVERKLEIKPTGVKLDLEIKWSAKGESHEAERSDDRESPREADTIASGS